MKEGITLDGEFEPLRFIRKSDSRLHRLIAKLPFIPESYMTNYWTTIGSTIAVPKSAYPLSGGFAGQWVAKHVITIRHEARHARRARKLTAPLYAALYLGPSLTVGPIAIALTSILALCGLGWAPLLWALGVTVGILPLSIGFAVFRMWDEVDAYYESIVIGGDSRAEQVAHILWKDYLAVPPFVTRWWIRRKLSSHPSKL